LGGKKETVTTKGVADLYEYLCDGNFYEWVSAAEQDHPGTGFKEKHICCAPVFYKDDKSLTLIEDKYDPINEEYSTWRLATFEDSTAKKRLPHRPYKLFQLETEDDLLVIKCKIRPVLVISKVETDWKVPYNKFFRFWLCLPLFSYKPRHSQRYVLDDQALKTKHRFYFPPGNPGLDEESAGLINEIQFIPEKNLSPFKSFCDKENPPMDLPIKLSDEAFHAVIGHIANILPDINISGESLEWYKFFRDLVNEQITS
jgi:hypothetical protein